MPDELLSQIPTDFGSHFSINRMMGMESVKSGSIETESSFQSLTILQAYDFVNYGDAMAVFADGRFRPVGKYCHRH